MNDRDVAKYIKKVRKSLGLTQRQMADRIDIRRYNLAKYETGATTAPYEVYFKIKALDPDREQAA